MSSLLISVPTKPATVVGTTPAIVCPAAMDAAVLAMAVARRAETAAVADRAVSPAPVPTSRTADDNPRLSRRLRRRWRPRASRLWIVPTGQWSMPAACS